MRTLLRVAVATVVALVTSLAIAAQPGRQPDWIRFRGPNGSGVSKATNRPHEFGPDKNLLWGVQPPLGYSSPILFGDRIYVTGVRDKSLMTLALDRATGKTIWEAASPGQ